MDFGATKDFPKQRFVFFDERHLPFYESDKAGFMTSHLRDSVELEAVVIEPATRFVHLYNGIRGEFIDEPVENENEEESEDESFNRPYLPGPVESDDESVDNYE